MGKFLVLICATLVGILLLSMNQPVDGHLQNCTNINSTMVICSINNITGYGYRNRHHSSSAIVKSLVGFKKEPGRGVI
uniref:Uncharacterized protein n=1 Tax=Anopheles atroparvus TaxID=41427 RepID=A0AAG5D8N6_ANOAO